MTETPSTCQPFVDDAVLGRLRDELQPDPEFCDRYITNYIGLLPARLASLQQSVNSRDLEAALDAVLSLKTSSLMVGASRLGVLARDLESLLRRCATGTGMGRPSLPLACGPLLESIEDCMAGTTAGLTSRVACLTSDKISAPEVPRVRSLDRCM